MRAALGAGPGRLARQLLAESLLLALAAGVVGLARDRGGRCARSWPSCPTACPASTRCASTPACSCSPSRWRSSPPPWPGSPPRCPWPAPIWSPTCAAADAVRPGAPAAGRRALVVAQVALAVTVVAAAGLLTRSLLRLQSVDMGLAADRLVLVRLALPQAKYADAARHRQFLEDVVAELEAAPGIAGATPVHTPPFAGTGGWDAPEFTAEGQSAEQAAANPSLNLESIHPELLRDARGDPRPRARIHGGGPAGRAGGRGRQRGRRGAHLAGREPDRQADQARPPRLHGAVAHRGRAWPGPRAIASWRRRGRRSTCRPRSSSTRPRCSSCARARPWPSWPRRCASACAPSTRTCRSCSVAPFTELLQGPLARPRFNALPDRRLRRGRAAAGAVGLYAVMAASVRQRHGEIGVRVALGATAADVRRLVLGEGLRLAGLGAAIGLAARSRATRLLAACSTACTRSIPSRSWPRRCCWWALPGWRPPCQRAGPRAWTRSSCCGRSEARLQQRPQRRPHVLGDPPLALGGRVDAVGLVQGSRRPRPRAGTARASRRLRASSGIDRAEAAAVVRAELGSASMPRSTRRGGGSRCRRASRIAWMFARVRVGILSAQPVVGAGLQHQHRDRLTQQPVDPLQRARRRLAADARVHHPVAQPRASIFCWSRAG